MLRIAARVVFAAAVTAGLLTAPAGFPTVAASPGGAALRPDGAAGPKRTAGRPQVRALSRGALLTWRGGKAPYRVTLRRTGRDWRQAGRTQKRRFVVGGLVGGAKYRFAVMVRLRHGAKARWVRLGRPSRWFTAAAAPGDGGGRGPSGAPSGGGSAGAPTTALPTRFDPAITTGPPADAAVTWVDPRAGDDAADGTRSRPVRTVTEAWRRIPQSVQLSRPHWIQLLPGTYAPGTLPHYWEQRYGSTAAPIVLNAAEGPGTAVLAADINAFDIRHMQILGLDISTAGDAFHCERCSQVQLRRMRLDSRGAGRETVKVNQSDHFVISDSDISGAEDNAVDFVAVAHSAVTGNRIHAAQDWCIYVKGGSAYATVAGNEIFDCGTGGFTAGQGTGFEFMEAPWLRYEAYGVTAVDNIIHDTDGAGLGVNGGYNIVMAFNTLYRVGARSHTVEFVHGSRSCDGDAARCAANRDRGGWGGPDVEGQWIPSKHVAFVNNVVLNPAGYASRWAHLQVAEPTTAPEGAGVPNPSRADEDLVLRGNVFSNGTSAMDTGLADPAEFLAANLVNTLIPDLVDPQAGDFRPVPGGTLASLPSVAIPMHSWGDSGVPAWDPPAITTARPPGALR